jgi:hypothetical protein
MKRTHFRQWLQRIYQEHRVELSELGLTPVGDLETYFRLYKYWLKREYRHQQHTHG